VRARKGDPETGRLLWAHTGGGGNFGVVTAYHFSGLPAPPEQVRVATQWLNGSGKNQRGKCKSAYMNMTRSSCAGLLCRRVLGYGRRSGV
jgi:hypothetical protein